MPKESLSRITRISSLATVTERYKWRQSLNFSPLLSLPGVSFLLLGLNDLNITLSVLFTVFLYQRTLTGSVAVLSVKHTRHVPDIVTSI